MHETGSLRVMACALLLGLCTVLLISSPALAQADQNPTQAQYITGPNNVCQNAQVVNTTTGTKDKQSPIFQIVGERSRITVVNRSEPDKSKVDAHLRRANGESIKGVSKKGEGTASTIVNTGTGNFYIQTNATNANYAVIVQVCANTQVNNLVNPTNPSTTQPNPSTTQPNPSTASPTSSSESPGSPSSPDGVVQSTVPMDKLADTGGLSPAYVALALGLALLGSGLFIYTSVRRGR